MKKFLKDDPKSKAYRRMKKVTSIEILDWTDAAGTGVARALSDYRKGPDAAHLLDAEAGLLALLGCVEVLKERDRTI